jgi:transmembrane sensor
MSKMRLKTQLEDVAISWLARLNSPSLTNAQEQEFMRWLEASPLHQAAYMRAEDLWQRGGVLARVSKTTKTRFWQMALLKPVAQGWTFAAVCLLALSFGLFFYLNPSTSRYTYQTAIGEQREVLLEDGSHIALNTNTKLSVELTRNKRIVYLTEGEVLFEVKKDGRIFDVITRDGVVRVVGTRFSVYQSGTDTTVTVAEGRVALSRVAEVAAEFVPSIVLGANERLSLKVARTGRLAEKLNANTALSWRKKQLVFKGQRLSDVITELGRYFPETITLGEPEIGDKEITAVIQLSDIKTTLQALGLSFDMHAVFDPSTNRVTLVSNSPTTTP